MRQRFSKKRQAIYDCLQSTHSHPSADWIYHQLRPDFPDLSLATVYRNLTQLKAAGLIQSLGVVSGQERFDAVTAPHTHFVCTGCGAVLDLPHVSVPEEVLSQAEAELGCRVTGTSLRLSGLCPHCKKTVQ